MARVRRPVILHYRILQLSGLPLIVHADYYFEAVSKAGRSVMAAGGNEVTPMFYAGTRDGPQVPGILFLFHHLSIRPLLIMTAMYMHASEHFNRFYGWVPPQSRQVEASRPLSANRIRWGEVERKSENREGKKKGSEYKKG